MIDIATDELLTLGQLAKRLPSIRGAKPNQSTIWRWVHKGIRGIRLETVAVGGRTCTTWDAYLEWATAIAERGPIVSASTPAPRRANRVRNAKQILESAGIGTK